MKRLGYVRLLAVLMFTTCARLTPEQQVVNDAALALGGVERLQAVRTLVMEGEGFLEDLKKRNLRVARIVPLHGKIVPYAQLVKDATAPGSRS